MAASGERLLPTQLADGQFYGAVQRPARAAGLVFSEVIHTKPLHVPEHSHRLSYFSLVLDGNYDEGPRGCLTSYKSFNVIFNPRGAEHEGIIGPRGSKFFTVELDQEWMQALNASRLYFSFADMNAGPLLWLAMRLRREHAENRIACPLTAEGLVWEMLGQLSHWQYDNAPSRPAWWPRLEEAIRSRFREKLSFAGIARDLGIHPVHLARTCRRLQRRTLGEYVQSLRVRFACELIQEREWPLAAIAFDAGFADQSHLTRMFRKFTGTTPARYRETLLS